MKKTRKTNRIKYIKPRMKFNPGTLMYYPDVSGTFPDKNKGNKIRIVKAKRDWYLGFLGFLGFLGIPSLINGDWIGVIWFVWFLWFLYFLPEKKL